MSNGEWEKHIKFQQLLAEEAGLQPSQIVEGVYTEGMPGNDEVMLEFKVIHWIPVGRYYELKVLAHE